MRLTIRDIQKMRNEGQPIAMLTAYDAPSARLAEAAEMPMLLVGDSLGMVVQGHTDPIPVRLEHIIYHAEIVSRVTTKPLVVADLPFMTYATTELALTNAARLMQEGRVSAVKLEGGVAFAPTIKRIVDAGIPVMAHIGLTPQSVNQFGGWRVQGKDIEHARQLVRDAIAVQEAGAFAVVVELVPTKLASYITELLHIPTIGIGAGYGTSGQVQVYHDLLTLFTEFLPRHTKRYVDVGAAIRAALAQYREEVGAHQFPTDANSSTMDESIITTLRGEFDEAVHQPA
jgi:3-methyl-2-oxobutanoate hydroxymethyltransferase